MTTPISLILLKFRKDEICLEVGCYHSKILDQIYCLLHTTKKVFSNVFFYRIQGLFLGVLKLNVDGSSFGNPERLGYGGLLKNYFGNGFAGFVGSCGITRNVNIELQAILYVVCKWLGILAIEMPLLSLSPPPPPSLSLSLKIVLSTHLYDVIVGNIVEFKHFSWKLSFSHILCECNSGY